MNTRKMTAGAMFIALGIVVPQSFHMIGGPGIGIVFLPMHLPVLIGAMLLGPGMGMIIGIVSVAVGFVLGMPAMPMAFFMLFELAVYGFVAGVVYGRGKRNPYTALVAAMFSGRLISLALMRIVIDVLEFELPRYFGTIAIFSAGIPGMLVQLVVVPVVVLGLERVYSIGNDEKSVITI